MQNYELLFILPGTMSEDEIKPVADSVKTIVEDLGGTDVVWQDLGKTRLAYPIKHIRYGYFQLFYFKGGPTVAPALNEKLRLMAQFIRVVLRKMDANKKKIEKIVAIDDVRSREPKTFVKEESKHRDGEDAKEVEKKPKNISAEVEASMTMDSAPVGPKEIKQKTETKTEKVKLDEIDKKLDELLETGMLDV